MRPDLMVAGEARLAMDAELTRVLERGMPGVDKRTVLTRRPLSLIDCFTPSDSVPVLVRVSIGSSSGSSAFAGFGRSAEEGTFWLFSLRGMDTH